MLRKNNNYFKEYCDSTSIHGFRYFGEKRTIFERIWWIIIFTLALSGCCFMIYKIYDKYERSPVIVSFATKETSISNIPFPTLTICPENYYDNLRIKSDFLQSIYKCHFMGETAKCGDIFTPIITDEGPCYSFNILDRSEIFSDIVEHSGDYHKVKEKNSSWSFDKGYSNGNFQYPHRVLLSGAENGLIIYLATFRHNRIYEGYRAVLHTPRRIPRLKQEYFRISFEQDVVIAVYPVMITTSDSVKSYDLTKRDCCFPSERQLKFFRSYSQLNCQLECLTNYTLNEYGCVQPFMPKGNKTMTCTKSKLQQILKISIEEIDCKCLPLCTDLTYKIENTQSFWNWRGNSQWKSDKTLEHLSRLTVYFKFDHFIASERNELFGPTDFLANFGGVLGLFTGFSILSLMEIIYFLTVRIFCNLKLYGNWSGFKSN